jgi:intermediate cleaving peptidase 55
MKSRGSSYRQLQSAITSSGSKYQSVQRTRSWKIEQWRGPRLAIIHSKRRYATVSAADLQFGQPVHETHPHLLRAGECTPYKDLPTTKANCEPVTPGITAQEYADRRGKLAASLPANGIAILAASDTKYRSGAVFYEFHQEPNFLYLTGFNEPEAVSVIQKVGLSNNHLFHLFLRPKNAKAEQWDGARSGEQAALDVFNADEVRRFVAWDVYY